MDLKLHKIPEWLYVPGILILGFVVITGFLQLFFYMLPAAIITSIVVFGIGYILGVAVATKKHA